MKRFLSVILIFMLMITVFAGCEKPVNNEKISIVCTIFPQYDWARQIIGNNADNVELTVLMDGQIDLHSYEPSVPDIAKISACDLFIYVGGESDEWVNDTLKEATNKNMVVINLLEKLGDAAKEEEVKPGMQDDGHDHGHSEDEHDEDDHAEDDHAEDEHAEDEHAEGETVYDEHVWLSLNNAEVLCEAITDAISSLDSENAETYNDNLSKYTDKLKALDTEYKTAVNTAPVKTLLFGDRFPFRYLVDDYGLDYHAAFVGCSAETEASFETVAFLAGKVNELNLKNVMVLESSDKSIARTVIENTNNKNQQILVMDSMQSITENDIKNGKTYLSIMESNLSVLKDALK